MNLDDLLEFAPGGKRDVLAGIADDWHYAEAVGIRTPKRIVQFMGQLFVESQGFRVLTENLNYTSARRLTQVWPKRFTSLAAAEPFVRNPQKLANSVYGKRMGNVRASDGWDFRGRGLKQLTGRANYRAFTVWARDKFGGDVPDFEVNPDLVATMPWAFLSAVWYWDAADLNGLADRNDTLNITKKINGGLNGLADRRAAVRAADRVWGNDEVAVIGAKGPAESPIGRAAIGVGFLGGGTVVEQGYEVAQLVQQGRDISEGLGISILVLVALAGIGYLAWHIYKSRVAMAKYEGV